MIKKSKLLKNLFTTASIIAVTASASSAMADLRTVNADASIGTDDTDGLLNFAGIWADNDSLDYNVDGAGATLTTSTDAIIGGIDLNGNIPGIFTVNNNVSLGAVTSTGGDTYLPITVASDQTLTLTATSTHLGELILSDNANTTLAINDGANPSFTKLNAVKADNGTLSFTGASTVTSTNIGNEATLQTVKIGAGLVNFTTANIFNATTTELTDAASAVTFSDDVTITSEFYDTTKGNNGALIFNGKTTLHGNIGNNGGINTVTFNADSTINGDLYTYNLIINDSILEINETGEVKYETIIFKNATISNSTLNLNTLKYAMGDTTIDNSTLNVHENLEMLGVTNTTNSTINVNKPLTLSAEDDSMTDTKLNLTNSTVIVEAGLTIKGAQTISTSFVDGDAPNIGSMTFENGSTITTDDLTSLKFSITDTDDISSAAKIVQLLDYTTTADANVKDKINAAMADISIGSIASSNRFVKWTLSENGEAVRSNNSTAGVNDTLTDKVSDKTRSDTHKYFNLNNTGKAVEVRKDMITMTDAEFAEAVDRSVNNTALQAENVTTQTADAVSGVINTRISALSSQGAAGTTGLAAGEEYKIIDGAWISPFYSTTTQKELEGVAGFNSNVTGAAIGFDNKINDYLTIGFASSYAKTEMEHKDGKTGDKTKANTFAFTIYAIQQLTNNWFLQGQTSYSINNFNNTQKRVITGGSETANGEFSASAYTAALLAGYNYMINSATVTPLLGASFTGINGGSYQESGTTNQNHIVLNKATNKLAAIIGLKAQMAYDMNGMNVTPEIHTFVKHDLIGKNGKVTVKQEGMADDLSTRTGNTPKTTFNVGLGVNAVSGMYEYGAGYDLNLAQKSIGHQGTVKVRLNF